MLNRKKYSGRLLETNFPFGKESLLDYFKEDELYFKARLNRNWFLYEYKSKDALNNEDLRNPAPAYFYDILVARGDNKVIVLSFTRYIAEYFLDLLSTRDEKLSIEKAYVSTQALINYLFVCDWEIYVATDIWCNYIPGKDLDNVNLSGFNVLHSPLFQDNYQKISCWKAGFRLYNEEDSFLTISSAGSIQLELFDKSSLQNLEKTNKFIRFLFDNKFIVQSL